MKELISTIDSITKYGLHPNISATERDRQLEKDLIFVYNFYLNLTYKYDNNEYPDFNYTHLENLRENIASNFTDFGLYNSVLNINDISNVQECVIGDAIYDLTDIIRYLLEVKWRVENNSLDDGLWYFELMFSTDIKQHILDLLTYMNNKNG